MNSALVRISKFLSLVLRHDPARLGLALDPAGWIAVEELLRDAAGHGVRLDRGTLERVVRAGHPQIPDLLAFRDYLRTHPSVARAYEAVKLNATTAHRHTITGYMKEKAAFMTETIGAARRWADVGGRTIRAFR